MKKTDNQRLREAVLAVINNQVRDNDPPETKQALARLKKEGFSEEKALELIGHVVVSEVFSVLQKSRPYDRDRYVAALNNLPRLPWMEGN